MKIRDALKIAARYSSKLKLTTVQPRLQLIVTVAVYTVPYRATHSHRSSVPLTTNKAADRVRLWSETRRPVSFRL